MTKFSKVIGGFIIIAVTLILGVFIGINYNNFMQKSGGEQLSESKTENSLTQMKVGDIYTVDGQERKVIFNEENIVISYVDSKRESPDNIYDGTFYINDNLIINKGEIGINEMIIIDKNYVIIENGILAGNYNLYDSKGNSIIASVSNEKIKDFNSYTYKNNTLTVTTGINSEGFIGAMMCLDDFTPDYYSITFEGKLTNNELGELKEISRITKEQYVQSEYGMTCDELKKSDNQDWIMVKDNSIN